MVVVPEIFALKTITYPQITRQPDGQLSIKPRHNQHIHRPTIEVKVSLKVSHNHITKHKLRHNSQYSDSKAKRAKPVAQDKLWSGKEKNPQPTIAQAL
jgi:hypothetical protein